MRLSVQMTLMFRRKHRDAALPPRKPSRAIEKADHAVTIQEGVLRPPRDHAPKRRHRISKAVHAPIALNRGGRAGHGRPFLACALVCVAGRNQANPTVCGKHARAPMERGVIRSKQKRNGTPSVASSPPSPLVVLHIIRILLMTPANERKALSTIAGPDGCLFPRSPALRRSSRLHARTPRRLPQEIADLTRAVSSWLLLRWLS